MPDKEPQQAAGNQAKPQEKLRSACDTCTASKVRCKKERPKCSRCERLGIDCLYGPSRRKGKPASSRTRAGTSQSYQQSLPTPAITLDHQTWPLTGDTGDDTDFMIDLDCPDLPGYDTMFSDFLQSSHPASLTPLDSAEMGSLLPQKAINKPSLSQPEASDFESVLPQTSNVSETPPSSHQGAADMGLLLLSQPHSAGSEQCLLKAIDTLSAISRLGSGPSDPGALGTTDQALSGSSMDQILLVARLGIKSLYSLSCCDCVLCTQDDSMPFVLIAIAIKVLDWFRAIYESDIRAKNPPSDGSEASLSETGSNQSITGTSRHGFNSSGNTTALTIGTLKFPQATERLMKALMLLCELEPFSQACKQFCDRSQLDNQKQRNLVSCGTAGRQLKQDLIVLKRSLEALCTTEC